MRTVAGWASAAALALIATACAQTDAGITANVKSRLAKDETVKAYAIDVDTHDHIVTLRGEVNGPQAKEQALRIARGTDGVQTLIDELHVNDVAATSGRASDPERYSDSSGAAATTGRAADPERYSESR